MNPSKLLIFSIVVSISIQGCKTTSSNSQPLSNCPKEATAKLIDKNVEDIMLTPLAKSIDGIVANNELKGYKFTGKKNQRITYQIKPNGICVWLYDSSNKLLSSPILPLDGTYILQIASSEGSGTFQLNLSINNIESTSEKPSNQSTQSPEPSTQPSPVSKVQDDRPSAQPSPVSRVEDNRPSAVEAVRNHYTLINNGDLDTSWNDLSDSFKGSNVVNGKKEYDDWWNQVRSININSLTTIRQDGIERLLGSD